MFKKSTFPFLFFISLLVVTLPIFATTGISPGADMANLPVPESIGIGKELFDNIRVNKNNNDLPVNPCVPSVYYPCVMYLTNVTIGTINNNSGCNGSYSDFSAQSTDMEIGATSTIAVSGASYPQYVSVYIDINGNDQMTDYGERVVANMFVGAGSTDSTSFTLPGNALPGSYIMRVISTYYYDGFIVNPCGQTNYGEAEDYTIIVTCPTSPTMFYADADGDGFGNAEISITETGCPPTGYVGNNTDCDDNNAAYNNATYWYLDRDGDGYYIDYYYSCAPPEGEGWSTQTYGQDCDDSNAAYIYNQNWYYDGDGDGYYGDYIYTCVPPEGEGWTTQAYGQDCDDNNAAYIYYQDWYLDADGDGYYSDYSYSCAPPVGEGWSNFAYSQDCDDTNADYYYATYWYYDGDGDGYFSSSTYTCIPPEGEGWSVQTLGADCDDANTNLNQYFDWYLDGDGDGYHSDYIYTCIAPEGEGWSNYTDGDDCDDTNAALNQNLDWFFDGDGDGYASEHIYTCITPEGEGWSNQSSGSDCDDTNAALTFSRSWFYDEDGDGYYSTSIYTCIPPEGEGWITQYYGYDCDDTNPSYQVGNNYYLDADGDGYYSEVAYACFLPGTGWSEYNGSGSGDCDDSNAAIHPGPETLGNEIDDNCDGLIDVLVYCTPSGYTDCNYNAYINNVELGTMSNASSCSAGYNDYSQFAVSANAGDEITYSVSISPNYAVLEIYIDYNLNGLFNDQGELVVYDYNYQYLVPFTGTIALPSGLAEGSYRIRIKADYGYYYNYPCIYHYGEIEDYTINIGTVCADIDLDGYTDQACGGNDCDDTNNAINPAATEICNDGIDDNCNGTADDADNTVTGQNTYYADGDGDAYGAGSAVVSCAPPTNTSTNNMDCDDSNSGVNPDATEVCNGGMDDDCDGTADNNDSSVTGQNTYYADGDGDGYGAGSATLSCDQPANTSTNNTDCNDGNNAVNPAATEICNSGLDDDCDGASDNNDNSVTGQNTYYADGDGDGYGAGSATLACDQPANTSTNNTDCNDGNNAVNPGATEVCNEGVDDDCDGAADNNDNSVTGQNTYYADGDGDGYGTGSAILSCDQPVSTSLNNTDCNDGNNAVNPAATEICNGGLDDDCDGAADNNDNSISGQNTYYADNDGDGYGAGSAILSCSQPANTSLNNTDCNDSNAAINPAAIEIFNSIDDNCDNVIDNVLNCVCSKPAGTLTSNISYYSATISWTSLPCAVSYEYRYRYQVSTGVWSAYTAWTPVATTSVNLTGLASDTYYRWTVRAVCSSTTSAAATERLFKTCTANVYYADADADGYGNASMSVIACTLPAGYLTSSTDCNDASAAIKPGATEICDGLDNNCDGIVDNLSACPKPTGLAYSNVIMTSATISWNALACPVNAYQYRIRSYSGGAWGTYGAWIDVATNTATNTGLTPATSYQYQVRAVCNGENKFSTVATGQIFTTLGSGLISAGEASGISEGVALEMLKSNYDVTVFPNPSAGKFTALISAEASGINVTLFVTDGFGRLLEQRQLVLEKGTNQQEIDLTAYPDAIYYIELRTESGVVHYPVVKSGDEK